MKKLRVDEGLISHVSSDQIVNMNIKNLEDLGISLFQVRGKSEFVLKDNKFKGHEIRFAYKPSPKEIAEFIKGRKNDRSL